MQKFPVRTYLFPAGTFTFKETNFEFYPQSFPSLLEEGLGVRLGVKKNHQYQDPAEPHSPVYP
jgi:hypothetical protein